MYILKKQLHIFFFWFCISHPVLACDITLEEHKQLIKILSHANDTRLSLFKATTEGGIRKFKGPISQRIKGLSSLWRLFLKGEKVPCETFVGILGELDALDERLSSSDQENQWTKDHDGALTGAIYKSFKYATQLVSSPTYEAYAQKHDLTSLLVDSSQKNLIIHCHALSDLLEMVQALNRASGSANTFANLLYHLYVVDGQPLCTGVKALRSIIDFLKVRDIRYKHRKVDGFYTYIDRLTKNLGDICDQSTFPSSVSLSILENYQTTYTSLLQFVGFFLKQIQPHLSSELLQGKPITLLFMTENQGVLSSVLLHSILTTSNALMTTSLLAPKQYTVFERSKLKDALYTFLRLTLMTVRHPDNKGNFILEHIPHDLIFELIKECDESKAGIELIKEHLQYIAAIGFAIIRSSGAEIRGPSDCILIQYWPLELKKLGPINSIHGFCVQLVQLGKELVTKQDPTKITYGDVSVEYFTTLEGTRFHRDVVEFMSRLLKKLSDLGAVSPLMYQAYVNDLRFLSKVLTNAQESLSQKGEGVSQKNREAYGLVQQRVAKYLAERVYDQMKEITKNQ